MCACLINSVMVTKIGWKCHITFIYYTKAIIYARIFHLSFDIQIIQFIDNNIVSHRSQAYDVPYNKTDLQTGVPCKLLSCCESQVVVKAICPVKIR